MRPLPDSPSSFQEKKSKILSQLQAPPSEYTDASPKGSVDEGIADLIVEINDVDGLVTTSSCAGRVSVFLEGQKTPPPAESESGSKRRSEIAGPGGKGGGGTWLYVSHDPISTQSHQDWGAFLGLDSTPSVPSLDETLLNGKKRLVHFKFEPMILHVLTASPEHAQLLLRCALQAGFRESGAVNVASSMTGVEATPIVAVRATGLGFDSLVGCETHGGRECLVSPSYLAMLVEVANARFVENRKRIERFRSAFRDGFCRTSAEETSEQPWEDAETRRQRKRAEGLRRRDTLKGGPQDHEAMPRASDEEEASDMFPHIGL